MGGEEEVEKEVAKHRDEVAKGRGFTHAGPWRSVWGGGHARSHLALLAWHVLSASRCTSEIFIHSSAAAAEACDAHRPSMWRNRRRREGPQPPQPCPRRSRTRPLHTGAGS